jgi:riboflavin kinase/FMN adenylyltransferase
MVEEANKLLESNFILEGIVIHGAKIGRTIGFPTANINYPKDIVKLPFGVYCALINGKKTVMNWGMKPTVNNTQEPVVEAHILDFDGDLYGKKIKIEVLKQIRGEKKFANLDKLKTQISEDVKQCLEL